MKYTYLIEDQLISIAAATPFSLKKDPYNMTEKELLEAEKEAAKYVHWIEIPDCYQSVPALKDSIKELPIFKGNFQELKDLKK